MKKRDSIRLVLALATVAVLGAALPATAKTMTTSACGDNVTSYIWNTDSNNNPFQLQNDGNAKYVTFGVQHGATDHVTSDILSNSNCDWALDLTSSTSRTVKLSLAYPASTGAALPAGWPTDGSGVNIPARVMTNCNGNSLNNGVLFGTMSFAGQTLQCGFHMGFYSSGIWYVLAFNQSLYAGATWAQVTCTSAASKLCNTWTVAPIPNLVTNPSTGQNSAIGELVLPPCAGCFGGTPLGLYYVSFSATITNP